MVFLLAFNRCNHYSKEDKGITDHEIVGNAHCRFERGDIETKFHEDLREVKRQGVIACFNQLSPHEFELQRQTALSMVNLL